QGGGGAMRMRLALRTTVLKV
ncbi:hypothetical protein A2U01_0081138, partial [Trifolium medium]|nr:hypothetical protein [Trifolium medium]